MEADWSVALGVDDPVVTIPWAASKEDGGCRFVDLRSEPSLIGLIVEARANQGLRSALLLLNSAESRWWTAKCDVWASDETRDPYEMDAKPDETGYTAGSYIDFLARDTDFRASFALHEQWLRRLTERLRAIPSRTCRVDLVLRHAVVDGLPGFAVTWFVEGCSSAPETAHLVWWSALILSLAVIIDAL